MLLNNGGILYFHLGFDLIKWFPYFRVSYITEQKNPIDDSGMAVFGSITFKGKYTVMRLHHCWIALHLPGPHAKWFMPKQLIRGHYLVTLHNCNKQANNTVIFKGSLLYLLTLIMRVYWLLIDRLLVNRVYREPPSRKEFFKILQKDVSCQE